MNDTSVIIKAGSLNEFLKSEEAKNFKNNGIIYFKKDNIILIKKNNIFNRFSFDNCGIDYLGNIINIDDIVSVAMCGGSYATYMKKMKVIGFCNRSGYLCAKLIPCDKLNDNYYLHHPIVKAYHKIAKI